MRLLVKDRDEPIEPSCCCKRFLAAGLVASFFSVLLRRATRRDALDLSVLARLERLRVEPTSRPPTNCVVELLACGIRPESKSPLNRNLERDTKSVPRSIGGAKVLVDLILVSIGRRIESAHIKKCAVGKRWLSPAVKIIAAV